jgi:glutamate racemase
MDKMHRPIGVFDSGVGGISVLRELVALMPEEDYIFYGDSKHAPYGTKTLETVQRLTMADAEYLMERQVKALVVACNTATSAAILLLRKKYRDIPVIGIEPALKPAVHALLPEAKQRQVLVMATPMTLREKKFRELMQLYDKEAKIIPLPCPGLVEFVERGELESDALEEFLRDLFAPYQKDGVDCVVLGCTHYPFVRPMVQKVLGEHVRIFDGGAGTARETRRRLAEMNLLEPAEKQGTVVLENSMNSPEMDMLGKKLLMADVK